MSIQIFNECFYYILLQKTHLQKWVHTLLYRVLKKLSPVSIEKHTILLESKFCKNRIYTEYSQEIQDDYELIQAYLPAQCSSVLDIGSGIGGIDVILLKHYGFKPDIFLFDLNRIDTNLYYEFHTHAAAYNSFEIAETLLKLNGVPENKIHLFDVDQNSYLHLQNSFDIVVSYKSWGFHYPLKTYLSWVMTRLKKYSILSCDLRKNTGDLELLKQHFDEIIILNKGSKHSRILARKPKKI